MTRKLENEEFCYVEVEIRLKTDHAILVHDGKREAWLPLSQIEDADDVLEPGHHVELLIPEWLATEKGLV